MRSVQRQSLSSRSSIASPLAVSENGTKPSWSLSAKLQMRSNSPSRFSLESHSSPTLERIGEACDDKVSTSCFGSYSKHERHSSGKAPLAVMDGAMSDDGGGKRSLDEAYCKAPSQVDKRSSKAEPDSHGQATSADHAASKEQKHRSSSVPKSESAPAKRSSCKAAVESEKSSRRRHTASSAHNSPASQVSSSPHVRSSTKASGSKDKSNSGKSGKASSGAPAKKEPPHGQEAVLSAASQHRQRLSSTPQSSASPSPTRRKIPSGAERSSASGRSRLAERSASQDLTRASTSAEKLSGAASRMGSAARTSLAHSSDGRRADGRTVRSSSSSSSVTSLRSSSVSSRDLRRNSKSEDKGLSFFKSALRQKETRRSADFGKTAILAKKVSDGTANSTAGAGEGSGKTGQQMAPVPHLGKASSKTCTPVRNSVLSAGKSKSSVSETTQSLGSGRKPADKMGSSRNLSSSTQSPARATQKPQ